MFDKSLLQNVIRKTAVANAQKILRLEMETLFSKVRLQLGVDKVC